MTDTTAHRMTEDQIERIVERKIDAIDRIWLNPACTWTQADYDAAIAEVDAWAKAGLRNASLMGV